MDEPLFRAIHSDDVQFDAAHARAAATVPEFVRLLDDGDDGRFMAKLRFRDPDASERLGEDRFFYLWLSEVVHHPAQGILSGVFFEVPQGFEKYHRAGERLGFDPQDVFDWMVVTDGHLRGGFTIRVTRGRLDGDEEKARYDEYIGVTSYAPVDELPEFSPRLGRKTPSPANRQADASARSGRTPMRDSIRPGGLTRPGMREIRTTCTGTPVAVFRIH